MYFVERTAAGFSSLLWLKMTALLEVTALCERLCPLPIQFSPEISILDSSASQFLFLLFPSCSLRPRTFLVLWGRHSKPWPPFHQSTLLSPDRRRPPKPARRPSSICKNKEPLFLFKFELSMCPRNCHDQKALNSVGVGFF